MARYTRSDLVIIVRNNSLVKTLLTEEEKVDQCVNALISYFVNNNGLKFVDDTWSNIDALPGRPRQSYDGLQLQKVLCDYLEHVANWRMNARKAVATAIQDHFNLLGYGSGSLKSKEELFWTSIDQTKRKLNNKGVP